MSDIRRIAGSAALVCDGLAELFAGHGVEAFREGDELRFPAHPALRADGEAFRRFEQSAQIDVRLVIGPGRTIVESVAGIGTEDDAAIEDGLYSFGRGTLPVLIAAFFGQERIVVRQRWPIGGHKRIVSVGEVSSRFGFPPGPEGKPDLGFFGHFQDRLATQHLPTGTHWVRLYQARQAGKPLANEVLFDNRPWPEMQAAMAGFDWPVRGDAYDVRVFLVIRDA